MVGFATWEEVIAFVEKGGWLWYHAPLDLRPVSVRVVRVFKNGKIKLDPGSASCVPFTVDRSHLFRLKRQVP